MKKVIELIKELKTQVENSRDAGMTLSMEDVLFLLGKLEFDVKALELEPGTKSDNVDVEGEFEVKSDVDTESYKVYGKLSEVLKRAVETSTKTGNKYSVIVNGIKFEISATNITCKII